MKQERTAFAEIAERWAASDLSPVLACHPHLSARVCCLLLRTRCLLVCAQFLLPRSCWFRVFSASNSVLVSVPFDSFCMRFGNELTFSGPLVSAL